MELYDLLDMNTHFRAGSMNLWTSLTRLRHAISRPIALCRSGSMVVPVELCVLVGEHKNVFLATLYRIEKVNRRLGLMVNQVAWHLIATFGYIGVSDANATLALHHGKLGSLLSFPTCCA